MKITAKEIANDRSLVGHIIMDGLTKHPAVLEAVARDQEADVILTINGTETDLRAFVDHWQSQVDQMIKEEAMTLMEDKLANVHEKMYDFESALKSSIDGLFSTP